MLSDSRIAQIVKAEEAEAIGYMGDGSKIQENRATLLEYYNQKPFGDEIDGQSQIVTSDVSDVVEGMLPQLLRLFTQGKYICNFKPTQPTVEAQEEAQQKKEYVNWAFGQLHDPVLLLHAKFKDALLQYTGVTKTTWDTRRNARVTDYADCSEQDLQALQLDPNYEIKEAELDEETGKYFVHGETVNNTGQPSIETVAPDELLVARRARDFIDPPFIGQRTPKTRSELVELAESLGFSKKVVKNLPRDDQPADREVEIARSSQDEDDYKGNPTADPSKDVIYLGEYYVHMDVDQDGVAELWQVFFAGNKVLSKRRVDSHPYAVAVPVPMPHKAVGSCPADQAADLQFLKSTLVRQMLNNVYSNNFGRHVVNERVDLDDLLTPRSGGAVRVDGTGPVGDSIMPMMTNNQVQEILQAIEYVDSMREVRTGITRYNQGLDTESLNKTATGFQGIRDMSQMRIELIARIFSSSVKRICEQLIELASKHQEGTIELMVSGQPYSFAPSKWKYKTDCIVDIGTGSGDRQEKIANLNFFYSQQRELMQAGSTLVDSKKLYNTLDRVAVEVGLKGADLYFNDPEVPEEQLLAENEILKNQMAQIQQQMQNPLAEAEQVKAQYQLQMKQMDGQIKALQEQLKMATKSAELEQKDRHHNDQMAVELTKIEAQNQVDVPGAVI